ncbi:MAG: protein kinase [Acidobacteriota bacterium]
MERLGSGGMGEVYKARHIHLQELRVIKILRQDRAADPTAMQRFTQEARTATQIKHPNVAILYDFSQLPDGRFYMVWEHIQGEDVGHWLKSRGPLPLPLAVELGIQSLRGLEAVHAAGVIHRDLSPDNLMITRDARGRYQAKIIDLGLAKSLANKADIEITQAGMFMGKLRYCSPEQAGALAPGESLDHRSDLYSFAAVLYEMVSGLPPFDSENQHGFVLKRLNEPPLHLEGRNPAVRVPRDLDAIVLKGLERERDRRYPDAVVFIQALAKFAERMRGAETQDMKVQAGASTNPAGIPQVAGTATKPVMGSAPPTVPGARAAAQAIERPAARELSREERIDLMAQIDRVAKKSEAPPSASIPTRKLEAVGPTPMQRAGAAVVGGRLDEARRLIGEMRAGGESPRGLDDLVRRLEQAERTAELAPKVQEAEQMLERYLHDHKQSLAALALDALLELAPEHPRRAELEARVARINEDVARRQRADEALAAGREALVRGDFRAARQKLEAIQANDAEGELWPDFESELKESETAQTKGRNSEQHKRAFENLMSVSRYQEAEKELETLSQLEVTKVTVDFYKTQLDQAKARAAEAATSEGFERRYRQEIDRRNWFAAREVAQEFQRTNPHSPRPAEMFAEISHSEEAIRKLESIEHGVKQVDAFIEQKRPTDAELALKILLRMDPENVNKRRLERQIATLWKA